MGTVVIIHFRFQSHKGRMAVIAAACRFTEIRHKRTKVGIDLHLIELIHVLPFVIRPEAYAPSFNPFSVGIRGGVRPVKGYVEYYHRPPCPAVIGDDILLRVHCNRNLRAVPTLGLCLVDIPAQIGNPACRYGIRGIKLHAIGKEIIKYHMASARRNQILIFLTQIVETAPVIYFITVICRQIIVHQYPVIVHIVCAACFFKGSSRLVQPCNRPVCVVADKENPFAVVILI